MCWHFILVLSNFLLIISFFFSHPKFRLSFVMMMILSCWHVMAYGMHLILFSLSVHFSHLVKCIALVLSKVEFTCNLIICVKLVLTLPSSNKSKLMVLFMEVYFDLAIILSSYDMKKYLHLVLFL